MLKELAGALQTEEDAVSVGGVGEEGVARRAGAYERGGDGGGQWLPVRLEHRNREHRGT